MTLDQLIKKAKVIADQAKSLRRDFQERKGSALDAGNHSSLRLAHYTSLEAVVSMLQCSEGGLRLSDSSTMNDEEEGEATSDGRTISRYLREEFGQESWVARRYNSANICCFVGIKQNGDPKINPGDDLLFWRLYGNECRGVSITIPTHVSVKLVKHFTIQEVVYTDEPPLQVDLAAVASLLNDVEALRTCASESDLWDQVHPYVLPECDLVMADRFLHKRSHYSMEREYRAIAFDTHSDSIEPENSRFCDRGSHVQYGLIRTYVHIPELSCNGIFTTDSQVTLGSNVPDNDAAAVSLKNLLESSGIAPSVVKVLRSKIAYRPR